MDIINTFTKGMYKDTSKLTHNPSIYEHAENFRIVTDEKGHATGAIINIRGTALSLTIPDVLATFTYEIDPNTTFPQTGTITIGGITSPSYTMTAGTTGADIAAFIAAAFVSSGYDSTFTVYSHNDSITIQLLTAISSPTTTISGLTLTSTIPVQSNLEIIGWGYIRDTLILFTTSSSNTTTGGYGQIWKVDYDETTSPPTTTGPTLLYNGALNFSKQYQIESPADGNYENADTQKIYWTDNNNPIRNFNIADPNGAALPASNLAFSPPVVFDIPILQEIEDAGGSLRTGSYQLCYRYSQSVGAGTPWSELSSPVNIILASETSSSDYDDYWPAATGAATGKAIKWRIDNVDTNFDRIECAYIYKDSNPDYSPVANIFYEEPVNASGPLYITLRGSESMESIDVSELSQSKAPFTTAKTIAVKDNRLFAGNVRKRPFDLDFDTRAYRFPAASLVSATVAGSGLSPIQYSSGSWNKTIVKTIGDLYSTVDTTNWTLDEEHDAINPRQEPYTLGSSADANFKFQKNGTTIGGSGKNIDYRIITNYFSSTAISNLDMWLDNEASFIQDYLLDSENLATANTFVGGKARNYARYSYAINGTINSKQHTLVGSLGGWRNHVSPYYQSTLMGYQREETYRFGIQFFDKSGNSSFVKWIADITMPSYYETLSDGSVTSNYQPIAVSGADAVSCVLGVEFTVRASAIKSDISGYTIVRVKRSDSDKTILGTGHIFATQGRGTSGSKTQNIVSCPGLTSGMEYDYSGSGDSVSLDYISFCSADHLLNNWVPTASSQDQLRIVAQHTLYNDGSVTDYQSWATSTGLVDAYYYYAAKMYEGSQPPTSGDTRAYATVSEVIVCSKQNIVTFSTGDKFYNFTVGDDSAEKTNLLAADSIGDHTLAMRLTNTTSLSTTPYTSTASLYYAYYYRPNSLQYGGQSHTNRANNEYVATGHYIAINNFSSDTDVSVVFGGDIHQSIFDTQKHLKNWNKSVSVATDSTLKRSKTLFLFQESTTNPEWRQSTLTVNRQGIIDNGTAVSAGETFTGMDMTFASSTDSKIKVPQPPFFVSTDEFDCRVYASELKTAGEIGDSWTSFLASNYWDVESTYGPLNKLLILGSYMLFWQDRAVGRIDINPRALVMSGSELQIGTGNIIQRHDYASVNSGTKHQHGVTKSKDWCYYYDTLRKQMCRINPSTIEIISDSRGMSSWFQDTLRYDINTADTPLLGLGITSTYDFRNKEVLFTFFDTNGGDIETATTLVFSEVADAFTGFYSHTPSIYINTENKLLSPNPQDKQAIHIHNYGEFCNFYGTKYPSKLHTYINPVPSATKIFDTLEFATEATDTSDINIVNSTFDSIRITNDYQNTDTQTLTPNTNVKRKERNWWTVIPRNRVLYTTNSPNIFTDLNPTDKIFGERIRDKYILVELSYNNNSNYRLVTHYLKTGYRPSPR